MAMDRPLTPNMLAVFGALREADAIEVSVSTLSELTGLRYRAVENALRDLRKRGLVQSRLEGSVYRLAGRPAPK
jgi:DNA-binding transcriptional ArsR family regulator